MIHIGFDIVLFVIICLSILAAAVSVFWTYRRPQIKRNYVVIISQILIMVCIIIYTIWHFVTE